MDSNIYNIGPMGKDDAFLPYGLLSDPILLTA